MWPPKNKPALQKVATAKNPIASKNIVTAIKWGKFAQKIAPVSDVKISMKQQITKSFRNWQRWQDLGKEEKNSSVIARKVTA